MTRNNTIADMLTGYLNQSLDPHDFEFYIEQFNDDIGTEFESTYDMSQESLEAFTVWIGDNLDYNDPELPPYMYFRDARALGEATVVVHFTRKSISELDRGATVEYLAYTERGKSEVVGDCDRHMKIMKAGELFQTVFAFGFEAERSSEFTLRAGSKKYGKYFLIFMSDLTVQAYHVGDNEKQVIFPVCTEYSVLSGNYDGNTWYLNINEDEQIEFDKFSDMVAYYIDQL